MTRTSHPHATFWENKMKMFRKCVDKNISFEYIKKFHRFPRSFEMWKAKFDKGNNSIFISGTQQKCEKLKSISPFFCSRQKKVFIFTFYIIRSGEWKIYGTFFVVFHQKKTRKTVNGLLISSTLKNLGKEISNKSDVSQQQRVKSFDLIS